MKKTSLILSSVLVASVSQAAVLTVTNTGDSGPGCLRECIADAEPGDEIRFDPVLDRQPIVLTHGELVIDKNLTITGRGAENTILDGRLQGRALYIDHGTEMTVALSGLTIRNAGGPTVSRGGGILNRATLTVSNSMICDNFAALQGGGIYNEGVLTLSDTTVTRNRTDANGGGVFNRDRYPALTVEHSTISDNVAGMYGGGIYNWGVLTVTNSTISGNSAEIGDGGGIYTGPYWGIVTRVTGSTISGNSAVHGGGGIGNFWGQLEIVNSTISGNSAGVEGGGGIGSRYGRLKVSQSTITGNSAADLAAGIACGALSGLTIDNTVMANEGQDCSCGSKYYPLRSLGHNLGSDRSCGLSDPSDQAETEAMLGPLQDNGGPTWTHVPLEGSPAIDRGWCDPGFDQRGVPRPLDGDRDNVLICDIGAVEYVPYEIEIFGPDGEVIVIPPDGG